jgi:hypothetical protein
MKPDRKPRGDSVLKTLPPARQDAIAEHAQTHKLWETVAWLKADGLKVGNDQVSKFLSWYVLRSQLRQNASTVEALLEDLKAEQPDITPEQLDAAGQMFFTALSIEQRDSSSFVNVRSSRAKAILEAQKLAIRQRTLELHQKKLEFEISKHLDLAAEKLLDAAIRKQAEEINASGLSQAEKIKAMRAAAFSDVDALQASGKIVIPKN